MYDNDKIDVYGLLALMLERINVVWSPTCSFRCSTNVWQHMLQLRVMNPHFIWLLVINDAKYELLNWLCRYEHLAKSAPTILDDSLSADSYLNVLYMPSTFPRSERSRRSLESQSSNSVDGFDFEDGPRSNLDNVRYLECVSYFQEVSCFSFFFFLISWYDYYYLCFWMQLLVFVFQPCILQLLV